MSYAGNEPLPGLGIGRAFSRSVRKPIMEAAAREAPRTAGIDRNALYRLQAEICRVLGHPRRLEILDLLANGERSTAELLRALGLPKANLSQHLALMKRVGLLESRRAGRQVYLRLAFGEIKRACQLIRGVLAARLEQDTRLARSLQSAGAREGRG